MAGVSIQHRCWNHETREAVCRCPGCGRSFCHECVTEHESRLLCAACLAGAGIVRTAPARGGVWRRLLPAAMLLAGVLLSWMFFFAAGETLSFVTERAEQSSWHSR